MTVRELQAILTEWHPDEEVALFSKSGKYMAILGLNRIESRASQCCVLDCDWTRHDVARESESDKLRRQRDNLDEKLTELTKQRADLMTEIDRADRREYRERGSKKKARAKSKKARTAQRKITEGQDTEPKKRGRPRKNPETDQLSDQEPKKTAL